MTRTLTAACQYLHAGFSLIPLKSDGSKAPAIAAWKAYQTRQPTETELDLWFDTENPRGIGLIHGAVSGHSEALDFDQPGLYEQFADLCIQQGLGVLLETLPLVQTPSGGRHLLYRCQEPVGGNTKLAETPERKTLIETRGEGGYTVAPGSAASCHRAGTPYQFLRGDPGTLPTITACDRTALLNTARLLNEYADPAQIVAGPRSRSPDTVAGLRPGDDYNQRGDWLALLEQHGWQNFGTAGDKGLWRRPGKPGQGLSATSNYAGSGLFYVFSANAAPFEPQKAYSPFAIYALLEHSGDFAAAAKKLGEDGYGEQFTKGIDIRTKLGSERRSQGPSADMDNAPHQSGRAWEPPVSFAVHSLPPFPVEALPPMLAAYVSEVAVSSQVPVDMAGMIGLGTIAVAAGRRCIVQIGRTHSEPTNLFCAVVMEPGSRKSQTVDAFAFPLRDYEAALAQSARADIAAADAVHGIEVKRLEHLQNTAAKAKAQDERDTLTREAGELAAQMTTVPTLPHLLADNVTPEALSSIMADNGGACAIISPEGGIFSILAGRYTDKQVDLDLVLKSHAGDEVRVDRKSRASEFIKHPALSLVLAVQPDVLASLSDTPSFRGRGLLGRFLYSLPESLAGTRWYQNRPVDPVIKAQYEFAVEQVLVLPSAGTEEDPTARHVLSLTGEALSLWAAFADEVEARQAEGKDLAGIRDWASKLAGQVARIAAGFHLLERAGGDWQMPISSEAIAAAWAIGQYLIPHALAAFGQMSADPRLSLAKRIIRWMERTQTASPDMGEAQFTLRDCQRAHSGSGQMLSAEEVQAALILLVERDFIRPMQARQETGGRPGSAAYVINPAVLGSESRIVRST